MQDNELDSKLKENQDVKEKANAIKRSIIQRAIEKAEQIEKQEEENK
ncbi:MAG: hypothetical protein N2738_06290 [Thermodesulfovibrionales bacterium]|nr:hypothetical protein [Thermodesulfovibrionales bacterium]